MKIELIDTPNLTGSLKSPQRTKGGGGSRGDDVLKILSIDILVRRDVH